MTDWLIKRQKNIAHSLKAMETVKDLTVFLNQMQRWEQEAHPSWVHPRKPITSQALTFYLYYQKKAYFSFQIPKKSGGVRSIEAPDPFLKEVQQLIYQALSCVYQPPLSAKGFVAGRTIRDNAVPHAGKRYVLNLDIQDFFPSISFFRVRAVLHKVLLPGLHPDVADWLARLCCHKGSLPQGAPTSPILSNIVCMRLDRTLYYLSRNLGVSYSRYADDITFSSNEDLFGDDFMEKISTILREEGFEINQKKVRLQRNGVPEGGKIIRERQEVTGVVVNARPTVPREYIRNLRALLHNWETKGYEHTAARFEWLYQREKGYARAKGALPNLERFVSGKIEYLGMIRGKEDPYYQVFKLQFDSLCLDTWTESVTEQEPVSRSNQLPAANGAESKPIPVPALFLQQTLQIWESKGIKKAMDYFYNLRHLQTEQKE